MLYKELSIQQPAVIHYPTVALYRTLPDHGINTTAAHYRSHNLHKTNSSGHDQESPTMVAGR